MIVVTFKVSKSVSKMLSFDVKQHIRGWRLITRSGVRLVRNKVDGKVVGLV